MSGMIELARGDADGAAAELVDGDVDCGAAVPDA
jgi:hypothetical protein